MKHRNIDDLPRKHKSGAEGYEFIRRDLMGVHEVRSLVRVYEILPGKSAYPYHYHLKNEETFFILRGEGILLTFFVLTRRQSGIVNDFSGVPGQRVTDIPDNKRGRFLEKSVFVPQ